jgi:DNA-binding transcriptional MerR regulator
VGVSSSQIRNWCTQFAGHLSADANPAAGMARTLTNADVATLQRVAELRADGVPYPEIPARLAQLEPGDLVPYVDSQPAPNDQPNQPAAIELYTLVEKRFQQMQGQIDQLQAAQAQEERRPITLYFLLGIVAGLLIVSVAVGVLMFGAWVGG